jgi:hypothetical protein
MCKYVLLSTKLLFLALFCLQIDSYVVVAFVW